VSNVPPIPAAGIPLITKGIERIECADRGVTHRPAARRVRVDIIEILEVRPVFQVTVQRHAVRCRSLRCSGDEKREDEPGEYYGALRITCLQNEFSAVNQASAAK